MHTAHMSRDAVTSNQPGNVMNNEIHGLTPDMAPAVMDSDTQHSAPECIGSVQGKMGKFENWMIVETIFICECRLPALE